MRSGFVAIVGRPNAGKSSLLNRLVGTRIAAVSPRPQTTWQQTRGFVTDPDRGQLIFVDTPGLHGARSTFNRALLANAVDAILDADAVLELVDATAPTEWDLAVAARLAVESKHLLIGINKTDLVDAATLDALRKRATEAVPGATICLLSALTGEGVGSLSDALFAVLPDQEPLFPADDLSDRPLRFFAGEFIRQAIFEQLHQELPYQSLVEIDAFDESGPTVRIEATVYVERDTQKAIVIGKGGEQVKRIGARARGLIEELVGRPVFLKMWVKVLPKWSRRERLLQRSGVMLGARRHHRAEALVDALVRLAK